MGEDLSGSGPPGTQATWGRHLQKAGAHCVASAPSVNTRECKAVLLMPEKPRRELPGVLSIDHEACGG
jgi:hypothetical protein